MTQSEYGAPNIGPPTSPAGPPRQQQSQDPRFGTPGGGPMNASYRPLVEETMVIPRQRDEPQAGHAPRTDPWEARGIAVVEAAPFGQERALAALAWIFPTVIMAIVGSIRLNWAGLNDSELGAWGFANTPWHDALTLLRSIPAGDAPYYLFIHLWGDLFGRSDYALRIPSVLAIAFAAGLTARIVTRLSTPRTGAIAALLILAIPATSRYAQNVGPQAFVTLTAAVATLALVHLLDRPRASKYAVYGLAVLALGASGVAGLVIVIAHGVVVVLMRPTAVLGWTTAAVAGAAAPVALALYAKPPVALTTLLTTSTVVVAAFGPLIVGGAVLGLAVIGVSFQRPGVVFAMWAVVPLALYYPIEHATTLDPSVVAAAAFPAWACVAAFGLTRAPVVRGVLAIALIVGIGMPSQLALRHVGGHGQATASLAAVLSLQEHAGDAIIYGPAKGDGQLGRDIVARYVSRDSQPTDVLATQAPRRDGRVLAVECTDVTKCLGKATRVWVIRADSLNDPLNGMEAAKDGVLRLRYTIAQTWHFTGLTLTLFVLNPSSGT
jgi:mannosyltransferase